MNKFFDSLKGLIPTNDKNAVDKFNRSNLRSWRKVGATGEDDFYGGGPFPAIRTDTIDPISTGNVTSNIIVKTIGMVKVQGGNLSKRSNNAYYTLIPDIRLDTPLTVNDVAYLEYVTMDSDTTGNDILLPPSVVMDTYYPPIKASDAPPHIFVYNIYPDAKTDLSEYDGTFFVYGKIISYNGHILKLQPLFGTRTLVDAGQVEIDLRALPRIQSDIELRTGDDDVAKNYVASMYPQWKSEGVLADYLGTKAPPTPSSMDVMTFGGFGKRPPETPKTTYKPETKKMGYTPSAKSPASEFERRKDNLIREKDVLKKELRSLEMRQLEHLDSAPKESAKELEAKVENAKRGLSNKIDEIANLLTESCKITH